MWLSTTRLVARHYGSCFHLCFFLFFCSHLGCGQYSVVALLVRRGMWAKHFGQQKLNQIVPEMLCLTWYASVSPTACIQVGRIHCALGLCGRKPIKGVQLHYPWLSTIRLVARRYGSCCLVSMVFFHLFFFFELILVIGSCFHLFHPKALLVRCGMWVWQMWGWERIAQYQQEWQRAL